MIEEKIKKITKNTLKKFNIEVEGIKIEHPREINNGDYAVFIPDLDKEKQETLINSFKTISEIEKVSSSKGFINFHLSREFFIDKTNEIIGKEKDWGKNNSLKGKKIMIEYTDPNTFKEFHIGHLMSNAIGESISRLVEFSGAETKRANYQSDIGLNVAKAVWGSMQDKDLSWGEAYTLGSKSYDENKEKIDEINKKLYEGTDKNLNELYVEGRDISLKHFEEIYKKLGTKFDNSFFESNVWKSGVEIVKENTPKVFKKSEGAIVFHGEDFDKKLHTRVFINSEGLPTYEAKELGLLRLKSETYKLDTSITITASEQTEYFKVVVKAMEQIFPELAEKVEHIPHGMMRLSSGKMSSRTGDIIIAERLMNEVEQKALLKMKDREIENKDEIAEYLAVSALKYSILKQASGKDIIYDLEKSLSFEGASGPYLQYAHTRAESILEKAKEKKINIDTKKPPKETILLERLLYRFPEVIERATFEHEPHYVTTYLTELASAFNNFYANERILDDKEYSSYKVALTKAFQITMKNGLWILGIKTPSAM